LNIKQSKIKKNHSILILIHQSNCFLFNLTYRNPKQIKKEKYYQNKKKSLEKKKENDFDDFDFEMGEDDDLEELKL